MMRRNRLRLANDLTPQDNDELISDGVRFAARFYRKTGRRVNITSEMGVLVASRELCLQLPRAVDPGYDALDMSGVRLCVRARIVADRRMYGPICINGLRFADAWDAVLLVLLDDSYEPVSMLRAERPDLEAVLLGSRQRKDLTRPAFSLATFQRAGRVVWPMP